MVTRRAIGREGKTRLRGSDEHLTLPLSNAALTPGQNI